MSLVEDSKMCLIKIDISGIAIKVSVSLGFSSESTFVPVSRVKEVLRKRWR
jgi:hypothetical protein